MDIRQRLTKWLAEKNVFYAILALNVILLFTAKFYPSMDGPSHLYNANLTAYLLKGDSSAITSFFTLNVSVIPNWMCYFILVLFKWVLPAWLAEKALLILYLAGLSVSFRLLVKQLCPANGALSLFIFPFAHSLLFHMGFYNFALSFVFMFFALYYWIKNYHKENFAKYVVLFVLLLLTYFSALLTFYFLGFCLGLFTIALAVKDQRENGGPLWVKKVAKEFMYLLMVSLPGILFSLYFMKTTPLFSSGDHFSKGILLKWLNDVRCLMAFDDTADEKFTEQFLHIAIAVVSISLFLRFYTKSYNRFQLVDTILIPALLTLVLFFTIPNGADAGMMSDRFCLLFFMFFIVWVSSQPLPHRVGRIAMVPVVFFHIVLIYKLYHGPLRELGNHAVVINRASAYIKENSVVMSLDMSDDYWPEFHFSNYLGVDKPLVILENYEASLSWFPVAWNKKQETLLKFMNIDTLLEGREWQTVLNSPLTEQVDYIFLYGNTNKLNDAKWDRLKTVLTSDYELAYKSDEGYVMLYKAKNK